ncbi:alpha/beta hydrolase [Streptomyces sp. NPDC090306]|uniref:alpha/beta hydrolase n=1 Tax=Streptomyces sp. NPDC090306 TaxID=3365961 RepID=UPI0037F816EB
MPAVLAALAALVMGTAGALGTPAVAAPAAGATATVCDQYPTGGANGLPDSTDFGISQVTITGCESAAGGWTRLTVRMHSSAVFTGNTANAGAQGQNQLLDVTVGLPPDYLAPPAAGFPSLYLLTGGASSSTGWSDSTLNPAGEPNGGNVFSLLSAGTSAFDGVAVMPEAGIAGFYTDWQGTTDGGFAPKWETYHLEQLVPWIDANFHVKDARSARSVAGLSMGGYGTLKYAADRPDLFSAVGAFSPGTELATTVSQFQFIPTATDPAAELSGFMWQAGAAIGPAAVTNPEFTNGSYRVNKYNGQTLELNQVTQLLYRLDTLFGSHTVRANPPATPPSPAWLQAIRTSGEYGGTVPASGSTTYNWPQANPFDLAAAGRYASYGGKLGLYAGGCTSVALAMTAGATLPLSQGTTSAPAACAYDVADPSPVNSDAILGAYAAQFDKVLTAAGVTHRYCYGGGDHSWRYWQNDMTDWLRYVYGPASAATATCPNA